MAEGEIPKLIYVYDEHTYDVLVVAQPTGNFGMYRADRIPIYRLTSNVVAPGRDARYGPSTEE